MFAAKSPLTGTASVTIAGVAQSWSRCRVTVVSGSAVPRTANSIAVAGEVGSVPVKTGASGLMPSWTYGKPSTTHSLVSPVPSVAVA